MTSILLTPLPIIKDNLSAVVDAGWMTSERQSPTLARCEKIFKDSISAWPCLRVPFRLKLNTEPQPRGSSFLASAWLGWPSSSG